MTLKRNDGDMAPQGDADRLKRVVTALGISVLQLEQPLNISPSSPLDVDGAPDQFEAWAKRQTDPVTRNRMVRILHVLRRETVSISDLDLLKKSDLVADVEP